MVTRQPLTLVMLLVMLALVILVMHQGETIAHQRDTIKLLNETTQPRPCARGGNAG